MRHASCVSVLSVPSSYFWQTWSPLALGHAIIITISRASWGSHVPCSTCPLPTRLLASRDPSYRSMIYGMPGGNPEDTAQDTPAQPGPLQICICRFPPEGPWDSLSSVSLAGCDDSPWQAKRHVTQCHADEFQHQCLLVLAGQVQTSSCMTQCLMASQLTTSSTVASMFRETFSSFD